MDLLQRWRRTPPQGVYALYDDGERIGPLPVVYSHYRRGRHFWEVLVPFDRAEHMRGLHVDELPAKTSLIGQLADAVDPYQWHVEGEPGA